MRKREFEAEVESNVRSNLSENVLTGKILMAIENLNVKCCEINRTIKKGKIEKLADQSGGFRQEVLKQSTKEESPFNIVKSQGKLKNIVDSLVDFKIIAMKLR